MEEEVHNKLNGETQLLREKRDQKSQNVKPVVKKVPKTFPDLTFWHFLSASSPSCLSLLEEVSLRESSLLSVSDCSLALPSLLD